LSASESRERSCRRYAGPGFHFRLRAPRFGRLLPAVARRASVGGPFNPGYDAGYGAATGAPPKSLIRMFGPRGNPQAKNLFSVIGYLQKRAGMRLRVAG
jgi:hypothetical protein